jgi:hypothetical protein
MKIKYRQNFERKARWVKPVYASQERTAPDQLQRAQTGEPLGRSFDGAPHSLKIDSIVVD